MPQCHLSSSSYPREPLIDPIYLSPCLPHPPLASEWLDGWLAQRKASPVCTLLAQCSPSLPSSSPEPHVAHPAASSRVNPGSSNCRVAFSRGLLTCDILFKQRRRRPCCGIILSGKNCVLKAVYRVSFVCSALADRCSPRYPCAALSTTPNQRNE
jgi:hypothetical protein